MTKDVTDNELALLRKLKDGGESVNKFNDDLDIEMYWELVRSGYLKNISTPKSDADWQFTLTDKANEYLKENK
jgi:hypothetical protein